MATWKIRMNYLSANTQAENLKNVAETLRNNAETADGFIDDLKQSWEGENADKFINKVTETKQKFYDYADRLDQLASALHSTAEAFMKAENQTSSSGNAGAFGSGGSMGGRGDSSYTVEQDGKWTITTEYTLSTDNQNTSNNKGSMGGR